MGLWLRGLRYPLAGLGSSLAPEGTPCRGIIDFSFSKSALRAQGSHLNSLNNCPPPGLQWRFSITGIRKVTSHLHPASSARVPGGRVGRVSRQSLSRPWIWVWSRIRRRTIKGNRYSPCMLEGGRDVTEDCSWKFCG